MATKAELQARLDKLEEVMATGSRRVTMGDQTVEYQSFAEMEQAAARLRRDIAAADSLTPIRQVRIYGSKGL